MADLSKIKLNGVNYNIKDTIARNAVAPPLATETTDGLMSSTDKQILNSLNPNITTTLSDIDSSEFCIINAKQSNALDLVIDVEPVIKSQIRTNNLLDVDNNTPGYYIGSNGSLSTNANDLVGDFIPVSPGDDIYYTGIIGETNSSSINRRLHVYKADKTWIKQISFAGNLHINDSWSTHGIIPANGAYIRVSWGVNDINVMISINTPTKYEPYYITPFDKITQTTFAVGPSSSRSEATEYTITVPAAAGDQYGFIYNPIEGKLLSSTGYIASYNGETLPGIWWSDRDIYSEDGVPSNGAEVVYKLSEENIVEYNFTPITIPLNYHINYFFIDNGFLKELSYYAETVAVQHLTIYEGITYGSTNVLESDLLNWNHAAQLIDSKANIDSPAFTGAASAVTLGIASNSDRLATTAFVQTKMNNLAPLEPTSKASRNYETNDYLFYGGQLYKTTSAIAAGSSLSVGNNIVATTIADELKLLFSQV